MICRTCGHNHVGAQPEPENVCTEISCMCKNFELATESRPVIPEYQKYLSQMQSTTEKIIYILQNIPELREATNKEFVFNYWFLCDGLKDKLDQETIDRLTDPETVRRMRQLVVERNPKYAPTSKKLLHEKELKFWGIFEFVSEK